MSAFSFCDMLNDEIRLSVPSHGNEDYECAQLLMRDLLN